MTGLQQEQPPLYDSLTKVLDASEQQILQGVIHEAEARSIAVQQSQAQMAVTSSTGAPTLPVS
jgi:importin-7